MNKNKIPKVIFLLYFSNSFSGNGFSKTLKTTTNIEEAKSYYESCKQDPSLGGKVKALTANRLQTLRCDDDWINYEKPNRSDVERLGIF